MAKYTVKSGDKAFRKVNVRASALPKFEEVEMVGQTVTYADNLVVLEVLKEDGTTQLHYNGPRMEIKHVKVGVDRIAVDKDVPTERLWVRRNDGSGIPYKVPANLPVVGSRMEFCVPEGVQRVELFGDKYFEKIFDLK